MHVDLDESGNPLSRLFVALDGRRIDLVGASGGAHPRQVLAGAARNVGGSISDVLDALDKMPMLLIGAQHIDGAALRDTFRKLMYDVTELFDVYGQLLPERLKGAGATKAALNDYKRTAKRLRDPWANICNKFKHAGSRLAYNRMASKLGPAQSHGYMLLSPKDGDAMVRDNEVHKPPETRATFAKSLQEVVHAILRVDLNAAKLVESTPDGLGEPKSSSPFAFPFGESVQRLCRMPIYVASERATYDGLRLADGRLELVRSKAIPLVGALDASTQFEADGHTRTFSYR